MENKKDFILKIKFLVIAILMTFFIKFSIRFLSLHSLMLKVEKTAAFFLSRNNPTQSINRINIWYKSVSRFLKTESCFVNSFIKKLIFSSFGHDLVMVCGVKMNKKSKIEGHAWLCHKGEVVFENEEYLRGYTESFRL